MSNLREAADKCPEFKATILNSIARVKVLLTQLKESFNPIAAASEEDNDAIWNFDSGNRAIMSEENSLTTVALVDIFLCFQEVWLNYM